jgi:hypothetical protein
MKTYNGLIDNLNENQIFVFGSNPLGINGNLLTGKGGSALHATKNGWVIQGEKMDNCLSRTGKSWGIVTVSAPGKRRSKSIGEITSNIKKLYEYASKNTELDFLIAYTAGGRNLNGYSDVEMAKMFATNPIPTNIVFEVGFSKLVEEQKIKTINGFGEDWI